VSDKGNARPRRQPETGQMETAAEQTAISCNYFTTSGTGRQPKVIDVLCRGRENAQTMRELRQVLNGDSRSIRLEIESERRNGTPILSDKCGYWLSNDRAEIERFCQSMRRRGREIMKTAAMVQLAELEAVDGGE